MRPIRITLAAAAAVVAAATLAPAAAAVDGDVRYQGRLTDAGTGEPLGGRTVTVRFQYYEQASGGSTIGYFQSDVPVADDGTFTAQLGSPTFFDDGRQLWVDVYIDDQLMSPRQKITSAPAAVYSKFTRGITVQTNPDPEFGEANEHDYGIGTDEPATHFHIRETSLNAETLDPPFGGNTNLLIESRLPVITLLGEPSGTVDASLVLSSTDANGTAATRVNTRWNVTKRSPNAGGDLLIEHSEWDGSGLANTARFTFADDGALTLGSLAGPALLNIMNTGAADDTPLLAFVEQETGSASFWFESDYAGNGAANHFELSSFVQPSIMTWTAGGNVGIGATDPQALLDVHGEGSGALASVTRFGQSGEPALFVEQVGNNTTRPGTIHSVAAGWGPAILADAPSNQPSALPLLARRSGSPGGTVPIAQFQLGTSVVAEIQTDGDLQITGNGFKPGGGSWAVISDGRLKKNVADLDGAMDTMLALRGVTFEYRDQDDPRALPGTQMGFIAQEVETVLPDWVRIGDDGYRMLSVRGFEALTVEAMRELAAENAAVRAMAERNTELQERVEALEALVRGMLEREGR